MFQLLLIVGLTITANTSDGVTALIAGFFSLVLGVQFVAEFVHGFMAEGERIKATK